MLDLHRKDGVGYEIGRYALCLETVDGVPVVERGKYVLVHERQQEAPGAVQWRCSARITDSETRRGIN